MGLCMRAVDLQKPKKKKQKKTKVIEVAEKIPKIKKKKGAQNKIWNENQKAESKTRHPQTDRHMLSQVNVTRLETHVG
jgi:uncharacterized protein (DUF305 family)